MEDDFERIADRTRTESAELRRRDEDRRSVPWLRRTLRSVARAWPLIAVALAMLVYWALKR
jgi:hypothetical protein